MLSQEWYHFMIPNKLNLSILHSWHIILLVIWKRSGWAFHRWVALLRLNGNAASHISALKKRLTFEYESGYKELREDLGDDIKGRSRNCQWGGVQKLIRNWGSPRYPQSGPSFSKNKRVHHFFLQKEGGTGLGRPPSNLRLDIEPAWNGGQWEQQFSLCAQILVIPLKNSSDICFNIMKGYKVLERVQSSNFWGFAPTALFLSSCQSYKNLT